MSEYPVPIPPELEGVVNALAGWAATHNPYLLQPGKELERDAWACGWKVAQEYGQDRADRAVALVEALGPQGAEVAPIEPMSQPARVKFVILSHFHLARARLMAEHARVQRWGRPQSAEAYAHAVLILDEEYEAARRIGERAAGD